MSDVTEPFRRQRLAEINVEPGSRADSKPNTGRCGAQRNSARTLR